MRFFFELAMLYKQSNPRFGCDFFRRSGNITLFVRWNKQKERARREIRFYGTESNKILWKKLYHKKNFINVLIWLQFDLWSSDRIKSILKCFEIILVTSMLRFFMFNLALTWSQKIQNFYIRRLLLTPSSNKRIGRLFEDWVFTIMLLTFEQNEHVWCLHQAHLPYFLMSSMSEFILNKI